MKKLNIELILQCEYVEETTKNRLTFFIEDGDDASQENYTKEINDKNYIDLIKNKVASSVLTRGNNSTNIFFLLKKNQAQENDFNSIYLYDIEPNGAGVSITNIRPVLTPSMSSDDAQKISYSAIEPISFNILLNKMANYLDSIVNEDILLEKN